MAVAATLLAALPTLIAWASAPPGAAYLGHQLNLDDHMVYSAWAHQAMEGRILFENRFTTDPQPGLTVHLYFLVVGWLAKATGLVLALTLARLALTFVFVRFLGRFLVELGLSVFSAKFALLLSCFGAGVGFLMWERFGQAAVNAPAGLASLLGGGSPIDVWQPEAFVFPSMLTNGLFMAALCLMVAVLRACWRAREGWAAVPGGAAAFLVLMNIHSYDALLLFLAVLAWFAGMAAQRTADWRWFGRVAAIGLGAAPAAAWFVHVLANDPVFQARAATPTYSPAFAQVLAGILPAVLLAVAGLLAKPRRLPRAAGLSALALFALLWPLLGGAAESSRLTPVEWALVYLAAAAIAAIGAGKDRAQGLLLAWALVGVVALYFPAPFQRKLAMGMIVPWAILAGVGVPALVDRLERSTRNLVSALCLVATCATSIMWLQREIGFVRDDVSRTGVHSVFASRDVVRILDHLRAEPGRTVVLAMPGVPDRKGNGEFGRPVIPDLNAVLTGMAGAVTYAGHWSETPDYTKRRNRLTAVFLARTPEEDRQALLDETKADFVVQPNPEAFSSVGDGGGASLIADLSAYGVVVYRGNQFWLVRIIR